MVRVKVTSAGQNTSVAITPPQSYYDGLSKQWAISDAIVNGEDYSSKHYAQESKKQAQIATEQAQTTATRVNDINTATETALNNIEDKRSSAVTEIATKQNIAVSAIEGAEESGVSAINSVATAGVANVTQSTNEAEESINSTAETQLANIQQEGATQVSNIQQTGFYMDNGKLYYIDDEGNPQEYKQGSAGVGLVAGFLYKPTGAIDESENIFRYANGQICAANDSIKGLLAWINKQKVACPSMFCTETEWQTAVTLSPFGQCGKYVINYPHEDFAILRCLKGGSTYVYKAVSLNDITQTTTTYTMPNSDGEDIDYTIPSYIIHKGAKLYSTTHPEADKYIIDENDFHVLEEQKTIEDRTIAGEDYSNFSVHLYRDDAGSYYLFNYEGLTSNTPFEFYFKQISIYEDTIESIRLPKIVNEQGCLDLTNCGITKAESLPNIKGTATCSGGTAGFDNSTGALTSAGTNTTANGKTSAKFDNMITTLNLDASNYSAIYQDNAHVQQEAIQYPYVICVNTGVEEAERPINNYQVNNVYSYGMSQYYKGTMNNLSWLRSYGQWNSGMVYTGLYIWLLEQLGASVDGFKFSTEDYTDYDWVINAEERTFRLPLKNGQEGVFASKVKGDGLALGLTNGKSTNGRGLVWSTSTPDHFLGRAAAYGVEVGTATSSGGDDWTSGDAIGITTDPTKSGLEVDLTVPEGYNLYYYVGDTLQNADLIDIARIADDVSAAKTDALNAKTELDTYKANQITYETEWFDVSPSGVYAFTLTGEKIAQCDYSKLSVQLVCKVKTATGSFGVGDIVYPTFANYVGSSGAKEIGTTVYFNEDVLTLVFGNDVNIVNGTGVANDTHTLPKANMQCKVVLKGEIDD